MFLFTRSQGMLTRAELEKMPEIPGKNLRMYLTLPAGLIVVAEKEFSSATAWNPQTGEVNEYSYYETVCYDVSTSPSYNGHYKVSRTYTV